MCRFSTIFRFRNLKNLKNWWRWCKTGFQVFDIRVKTSKVDIRCKHSNTLCYAWPGVRSAVFSILKLARAEQASKQAPLQLQLDITCDWFVNVFSNTLGKCLPLTQSVTLFKLRVCTCNADKDTKVSQPCISLSGKKSNISKEVQSKKEG